MVGPGHHLSGELHSQSAWPVSLPDRSYLAEKKLGDAKDRDRRLAGVKHGADLGVGEQCRDIERRGGQEDDHNRLLGRGSDLLDQSGRRRGEVDGRGVVALG